MRHLVPTLLVTFCASLLTVRGAFADEAIVAAEKNWAKAVMAMDFKAMEEIYSDDLIYAHSTGVVESKKEYLDKLRKGTQKYELVEHENTTTKVFGNAAIAHATVRMKGTSSDKPFHSRLMLIHVWVMQGGKWRMVAHQTTKLADL
jgi:ketosteroid isomerase-like protein